MKQRLSRKDKIALLDGITRLLERPAGWTKGYMVRNPKFSRYARRPLRGARVPYVSSEEELDAEQQYCLVGAACQVAAFLGWADPPAYSEEFAVEHKLDRLLRGCIPSGYSAMGFNDRTDTTLPDVLGALRCARQKLEEGGR